MIYPERNFDLPHHKQGEEAVTPRSLTVLLVARVASESRRVPEPLGLDFVSQAESWDECWNSLEL